MVTGAESVIIIKQNKYIKVFNDLGAIDSQHSIDLDDVGIRRSNIFDIMIDRGIFIECENNKFYIDNQAAAKFKDNRRKKALIVLILSFAAVFASVCYLFVSR